MKQDLKGRRISQEAIIWSDLSFTLSVTQLLPGIEELSQSETEFRLERIAEVVFIFIMNVIPMYRCLKRSPPTLSFQMLFLGQIFSTMNSSLNQPDTATYIKHEVTTFLLLSQLIFP